jgi:hypothetical protein
MKPKAMGLEFKEARELVHIRHELRMLVEQPPTDRQIVAHLLQRMASVAACDPAESAAVQTELRRWKFVFGLDR